MINSWYSEDLNESSVLRAQHMPESVGTLVNKCEQLKVVPATSHESSILFSPWSQGNVENQRMRNNSGKSKRMSDDLK